MKKTETIQEVKFVKEFKHEILCKTNLDKIFYGELLTTENLRFFKDLNCKNFYYAYNPRNEIVYSLPYNSCSPSTFGTFTYFKQTKNFRS